ncbi:MAG: heterodisulfide reductase-related iron-sulfur binding cluster [Dehalococcoidales bacterium]|nr:heterodisulfide reductase-related iron-sulfur binding cluster [Dehalococcoidales bacterium]
MAAYGLFLGCTIPNHLPHLELAARKALAALEVETTELIGATCCPDPVGIPGLSKEGWLAIAGRNLCLAEEQGVDILTLCNGCYETLKEARHELADAPTRAIVNEILAPLGKQYQGKVKVLHLVELLHRELGPAAIAERVTKPLTDLRVAVHYGCHLVRPSEVLALDDPEAPVFLDELVGALGTTSVPYPRKMLCCGAGVKGFDKEQATNIGRSMAREKLLNVRQAEADCMVVTCPTCMSQFDVNQGLIERAFGEKYDMPVFYYAELLALALGVPPAELGFQFHRAKVDRALAKLGEAK